MSIAWVWALRAIRLLRMVAYRWIPEEYADLMVHALGNFPREGSSMQQGPQELPSCPHMPDSLSWDDLVQHMFDPSWPGGDLFRPELSFFDFDQWPDM